VMVFKLRAFFGALTLLFFISACNTGGKKDPVSGLFGNQQPDSVYTPLCAKGFSIAYYNGLKLIHVEDPWDSTAVGTWFLVGDKDTPKKFRNTEVPFIQYPVTNWSAFSSTQIVFADKIGVLPTLKSVAEPRYISNPYVQKELAAGNIRDAGLASAANIEVLLDVSPQFIFVSPFKDNRYNRLQDAGLQLINDGSYMELSPLGRAEWLVFFSTFFNREREASNLFKDIVFRYNTVKEKVEEADNKPTILTGTLFNDIWYMPAGNSYMARLFADAGVYYRYSNRPGTGSLALDFETVFNDFRQSEYWVLTVNHEGKFTKKDFLEMDNRYGDFQAFREGRVLFSNTSHSLFYEKGIIEPDVVLKDLSASFHPYLFPGYTPVYFEFLKE
jgi:iron complex transport system substrate-binding protein